MPSERYEQIIQLLKERFVPFLETIAPLTLSTSQFKKGVDALPDDIRSKVMQLTHEFEEEQSYEVSYNQLCKAFFGATHQLGHLQISD